MPGAPHSQAIALIATTEQADVAFTVDGLEQARLWPALDGSREPVMVHVPPADDVALVRTRDGLLAVVLDTVGGLELIRFDVVGAVIGRTRLAPDPGFAEIDALGDRVLALRRDQVLVVLDAQGAEQASLAANPGEHIRTVSTRGGGVIVGLAAGATVDRVRIVGTTSGLTWGAVYPLPAPLTGSLALSPSGKRIAGLREADGQAVIVTPTTNELMPVNASAERFPAATFLGFLDEDTLLVSSGTLVRWWLKRPISQDPWETPNLDIQGNESTLALANGLVVGARGTGLQLVDPKRSRYLGYRQLVNGGTTLFGDVGAIVSQTAVTWFGPGLSEIETRTLPGSYRDTFPIDRHHVVAVETLGRKNVVYLHGAPAQPPILLGTWEGVGTVTYHPATRVLAIPTQHGTATHVVRFELDVATHTTRPLRTLITAQMLERLVLLDPAEAHGQLAVGIRATGAMLVRFREEAAEETQIGIPLGVDREGTAYFLDASAGMLVRLPANAPMSTREVRLDGALARGGQVSPDGQLVVLTGQGMVVALGTDGVERWRFPAHDASVVQFHADGRTVLIPSMSGGIIAVDAANGHRVGRACAFGFELSEKLPNTEVFTGENACTVEE
ncbi:MAG: hypothetical protein SFX73_24020 [Kofleriaceae bacterium]|nr:hypothetical protein [Kofleriaceae bacterium]